MLSVIASPLQVFMLKMWVSQWNAHSHPLMRASTWLILITPLSSKSLRKALCTATDSKMTLCRCFFFFLLLYFLFFHQLKLNPENLHTTPRSSSALKKLYVHLCSAYQWSHLPPLSQEYALLSHVTATCAASFCSAVHSFKLILQEKLACGLISLHESDSCVARQRLDTQRPHVFILLFFYLFFSAALQLSAFPLNYQSIHCW